MADNKVTFECGIKLSLPAHIDQDTIVDKIEAALLKAIPTEGILTQATGIEVFEIDRTFVGSGAQAHEKTTIELTDQDIEDLVSGKKGAGGGFSFENQGDGTSWLNVHGPDRELFDGLVPDAKLRQFLLLTADA